MKSSLPNLDAARRLGAVVRTPLTFLRGKRSKPGTRPGIEHHADAATPPPAGAVRIACLDWGPEVHRATEVGDLVGFLARPRPEGAAVRWLNVDGLHAHTIRVAKEALGLHTLAAEDVLHTNQRPKVEAYGDHLFIVAHMLTVVDELPIVEQVSMFLFEDLLVTFQQRPGDVFDAVRGRIATEGSRLRTRGPDYLLYALLDAIVDGFFPVLEAYGDRLDEIEARVLERPDEDELQRLYGMKQELVLLRRVIWPTRNALEELIRAEDSPITERTTTYLRDVQDHAFQVLDIVEAYRETASSLTDLYMTSVANRTNDVMKVLTIMASVFIPTTFLAGVYGMNFEHIPELGWRWAYPVFWGICITMTAGLLLYFRAQGWIGRGAR